MGEFTRYASPAGSFVRVAPLPEGGPDGEWMAAFMTAVEPILVSARHQSNYAPLGVKLALALPEETDLLRGHVLHTLLEPLAVALGLPQLRYAEAAKAHGAISTLCVGPVGFARRYGPQWERASARCEDASAAAQRAFGHRIASQVTPTRWGPVQLDLALRTGVARDWIATWKPLIASLVAILGRRLDANEADIEDGRIVALALHHDVDTMLGHAIEVDVRWRLLERAADAPVLEYYVERPRSASSSRA